MNVILAKSAGFCFGVKRAVDTVYERILEKEPLYTFGPIIHNEEVVRDRTGELAARFAERERAGALKGEIVIVIDGPSEAEGQAAQESSEDSARVRAAQLKAEGVRNKDIAKTLAAEFGLPRNAAYEIALEA